MSKYPYILPDFLQNQSADEIHSRMLSALPDDMDKSELSIPWDFTRPTALEISEFTQLRLNETIKVIFPQWAYGKYLDMHAETVGLQRRNANKASGYIEITGIPGTVIPVGFLFATPANNDASILFEALEELTLGQDGMGILAVEAVEGGRSGNVAKDTVILMVKPISGIKSVTNKNPITGGSSKEDDETLRTRVIEALRNGVSYVGNDSDYLRWAKEVLGVGGAVVIPEHDGPGTVLLVIVDLDGLPANDKIIESVYKYIISPEDRINRLAPVGATLTVTAPSAVTMDIDATVILKQDADIEVVREAFIKNIGHYCLKAATEKSVKYVYVGSVLAQTEGVADYMDLTVNGGIKNIPVAYTEFPVIGEVILNAYA